MRNKICIRVKRTDNQFSSDSNAFLNSTFDPEFDQKSLTRHLNFIKGLLFQGLYLLALNVPLKLYLKLWLLSESLRVSK